jgi:hypothetical protein
MAKRYATNSLAFSFQMTNHLTEISREMSLDTLMQDALLLKYPAFMTSLLFVPG